MSVSRPAPKPDATIRELGNPVVEGGEILSLTTGPDGRIYGGTNHGSAREGGMFVYDPAAGQITVLASRAMSAVHDFRNQMV